MAKKTPFREKYGPKRWQKRYNLEKSMAKKMA